MSIADYSPHASARRFDSGTPPVPALYAGVAGVSLVAEAGVPAVESHIHGLVDRLLDGLDALAATVPTPRDPARRGPLVCIRSTDVTRLVEALAEERIVVSSREDKLRVALHLYNVEDDVDRLLEALGRHRTLLA
jgi:selenocysteine lyase/cysteine desulfurase